MRVDYGLVIRTANPFNPHRRLIVLSGCHTYGVVAAARFAAESSEFKTASLDCAFALEAKVRDAHSLPPTIAWQSDA